MQACSNAFPQKGTLLLCRTHLTLAGAREKKKKKKAGSTKHLVMGEESYQIPLKLKPRKRKKWASVDWTIRKDEFESVLGRDPL